MRRCCDWLFRRLLRPGDTTEDDSVRRLLLPVAVFFAILTAAGFLMYTENGSAAYLLGCATISIVCILMSAYVLLRIPGSYRTLLSAAALPILIGVLAIDLYTAANMLSRRWPTIVLLIDFLVIVDVDRRVQMVVVIITVVYLTVMAAEAMLQFGLYSFGRDRQIRVPVACHCSDPPCVEEVFESVTLWLSNSCVFVIDFFVTRGFAMGLRYQMKVNTATVTLAERVAQLLANYAIDEARDVVAVEGKQLSEGLRSAFGKLLDNLERYRAFLPPGLLAGEDGADELALSDGGQSRVVPQLAVPLMRRAVEVAWSQAAKCCRDKAEQALTGILRTCVDAHDAGAQHLLDVGWSAPVDLIAKVKAFAHDLVPDALQADRAHHQRQQRLSMTTGSVGDSVTRDVAGRFGDGADDPAASLAVVPLWPAEYVPPSPLSTVRDMAHWHEPSGRCHWLCGLIDRMLGDFCTLYNAIDPGYKMLGLYVYTAELCADHVCALWRGNSWTLYNALDGGADHGAVALQLGSDLRRDLGLGPEATGTAQLLIQSPHGMCVYGVEGEARLLRYENICRGDPEASPLNDAVLWAPHPDCIMDPDCMFSMTCAEGTSIPTGILEYITSRDFSGSYSGSHWESFSLNLFSTLHEQCMAQKNQQRPKDHLCQMAKRAFCADASELGGFGVPAEQLAAVLPVLYRAKCPGTSPTPAQIAQACELGVLRWQRQYAVVAFTGAPRIAVPLSDSSPRAVQLWRLSNELWPAQPYLLMNSAMRSQQLGDTDARLSINGYASAFHASQPAEAPPAPEPVVFRNDTGFALWLDDAWAVTMADGPVTVEFCGELAVQGWGLPQYRALIWLIDNNLSCIDPGPARRLKGYRGLHGVTLSRAIYCRGKIVMFPAFTSTSSDQGVAAGFAAGEGAAVVFTMYNASGRHISAWSRFGREKEVLLRPNTLHLVTDALSAEHAAIVDKEALQVFDLREVAPAEAVSHLAKEGALAISGEHPSVMRQVRRAGASAERGDWDAALLDLLSTPADAVAGESEGRFVRSILPKSSVGIIVLVLSSSDGHEVGSGVDQWLWNSLFELAEAKAQECGAHLITTNLGHIMVQVAQRGGAEGTAQAAVALALELVGIPSEAESPVRRRSVVPGSARRAEPRQARATASHEQALRVHCGVSVGTVHCGFGGSAQRRVEIADGPAVRRAFRMAAYSLRHGVTEVVTDTGCASAAAVHHTTWAMDLVSFDPKRDVREPISCIEKCGMPGAVGAAAARCMQEAWDAVVAATEGTETVVRLVRERLERLPAGVAGHRAVIALRDAVAQPSTYCYDLEGTH